MDKGKAVAEEGDTTGTVEFYVQAISDEDIARQLQEAGEAEAEGCWIEPLSICPHVGQSAPFVSLPRFDSPCERCGDEKENWVCLTCNTVLCGRYRGAHMLEHNKLSKHPFAMGFRDLSVWCFTCSAYLDAEVVPELKPHHAALHLMKFGEAPPPR